MMFSNVPSRSFLLLLSVILSTSSPAHDGPRRPLPQPPQRAQADVVLTPPTSNACQLTLRLVNSATGETIPGMIYLTDAQGATIRPAELLPRTTAFSEHSLGEAAYAYMDRWFILPGERTLLVPRGPLTVQAFRGVETKLASATLDLTGQSQASHAVVLDPISVPGSTPWVSGNVHLHLQKMTLHEAERYGTEVAMGDGLDLVFLSYLERAGADAHYISNTFTAEDLQRFHARSGVLFGYGEEYRHNFQGDAEGYGHVMLLDLPELILPASFGFAITKSGNDDGVLRTGIEAARRQQATVLWCHNARGQEDIPNWVAGLIDGQIIFDSGATGDYQEGFYRYLNIGLRVPVTMGTDWFYNDMAMTMVALDAPLSTETWLAALRAGHTYITNGPLVRFTVDGAIPGATVELAEAGTVHVRAEAVARDDFVGLELVANGAVVNQAATTPESGGFRAVLDVQVPVAASTWLAVRATPFEGRYDRPEAVAAGFNEYGKPLFAHTSPVYILVDGRPVFVPAAAESLIAELRSSMVTIRHTGKYTDDGERDKVLAIYESASAVLREKLGG